MQTSYNLLVTVLWSVLVADVLVLAAIVVFKVERRLSYLEAKKTEAEFRRLLALRDRAGLGGLARRTPGLFIRFLRLFGETWRAESGTEDLLRECAEHAGLRRRAERFSRSFFLRRRLSAYFLLGFLADRSATDLLARRLGPETSRLGRILLLHLLRSNAPQLDNHLLAQIVAGLARRLSEAEKDLLVDIGRHAGADMDMPASVDHPGVSCLRIGRYGARPDKDAWERLERLAEGDPAVSAQALRTMAVCYPPEWFLERYGSSRERDRAGWCCELLGRRISVDEAGRLVPYCEQAELKERCIAALSELDRRHPEQVAGFLPLVERVSETAAETMSLALEFRLPYLLHHAPEPLPAGLRRMLVCLLRQGRNGAMLKVLEDELAPRRRQAVLEILRGQTGENAAIREFFQRNAAKQILDELGLVPVVREEDRPRIPVKKSDKLFLVVLIAASLAVFPAAFVLRWHQELDWLGGGELLYRFVFDFHAMFAWYTLAINGVYLGLLLLSAVKLSVQSGVWESDVKHTLLSSQVLPTVSIIAPAFNEEKTIADSVESLLALMYPNYTIVVVNDGSTDRTLQNLITVFQLEPSSSGIAGTLPSMPVRTVYRSNSLPNLMVVDKVNGGKADALNAGLNFSDSEYVCCIDADSLLDSQALLRSMTQILNSPRPVVAMGGNILPVNGSEVEHGHLQKIGLPSAPLAAFQTMEYLRSFVSGRLGWALLDSLLIVSGAFGLFLRDRVIAAGGYMTGKGQFRKDTVGEDMELVVRLARLEKEHGGGGKVDYCYNANCWTEVPEDETLLQRQRDRWHRGLIEVLLHHRGMLLSPRYGAGGMLGMPYFFIFELVGPWLEASGYAVMAFSLLFSLIDPLVSLVVFSIAVATGILISVASLLLAERQVVYFRFRDFFKLVLFAILENFGFRQKMSLLRVQSFVQYLYKNKGWQKFARKGFGGSQGEARP